MPNKDEAAPKTEAPKEEAAPKAPPLWVKLDKDTKVLVVGGAGCLVSAHGSMAFVPGVKVAPDGKSLCRG